MPGTVGSTGHKLDMELADGQYSEVLNLTLVQTDPSPDYLQGNSQNPEEKADLKISGSDLSVLTPGKKDRDKKITGVEENKSTSCWCQPFSE